MGTNKNLNAHCHIAVFASAAHTDTAWACVFTAVNCKIGAKMNALELFVEFIAFFPFYNMSWLFPIGQTN